MTAPTDSPFTRTSATLCVLSGVILNSTVSPSVTFVSPLGVIVPPSPSTDALTVNSASFTSFGVISNLSNCGASFVCPFNVNTPSPAFSATISNVTVFVTLESSFPATTEPDLIFPALSSHARLFVEDPLL